jgi:two-component system, NtrC family, response regulator HydG
MAEVPVDVRVVAATNRDLAEGVARGSFRADLYARLAELVVELAPLRERPEDLEPLWCHYVSQLGQGTDLRLSGPAFEAMALYAWPFNVRELRQLVRKMLLLKPNGGELAVSDLPPGMRPRRQDEGTRTEEIGLAPKLPLVAPGEVPSKEDLRRLVEEFDGNIKEIANFLGKDRKQVYRWLRREQIDPDAYRLCSESPSLKA